jgi:ribonuclease HI
MKIKKLIIYTDGGARGNPGPAGIGVYIVNENREAVGKFNEFIGKATNNQAEYKAVILALGKARGFEAEELEFFLDSELVVKQLNREYRVKDKDLASLYVKIYNSILSFKKVTFTHIPREKNKEADKLVNVAIDEATKTIKQ